MSAKSTLCILFRDEEVQAVFVDRTVLGAQVKFMERFPRDERVYEEIAKLTKSVEKTPSRVLLCPPREMVMQRTLSYPAVAPADIASMIQFEATRHVEDSLVGRARRDDPQITPHSPIQQRGGNHVAAGQRRKRQVKMDHH